MHDWLVSSVASTSMDMGWLSQDVSLVSFEVDTNTRQPSCRRGMTLMLFDHHDFFHQDSQRNDNCSSDNHQRYHTISVERSWLQIDFAIIVCSFLIRHRRVTISHCWTLRVSGWRHFSTLSTPSIHHVRAV